MKSSSQSDLIELLQNFHHQLNQPMTTILLMAEMGSCNPEGLGQSESEAVYQAALQCRQILANLNKVIKENELNNRMVKPAVSFSLIENTTSL